MPDIFLSYSEKDRATAGRVADALQATGWSVWWDRQIPAGQTWRDVLTQALEQMRCMVVLWSADSVKSQWVCEEAEEGKTRHCLVPVCIAAVRPPTGFRSIQAADLIGWDGDAQAPLFQRLVADIRQMIGAPPGAPPAGPPGAPLSAPAVDLHPAQAPRRPRQALWAAVLLGAATTAGLAWWSRDRLAVAPLDAAPAIALPSPSATLPRAAVPPADAPASGKAATSQPVRTPASRPAPATKPPPARPTRGVTTTRCSELTARAALSDTLPTTDRQQLEKECAP
jgi:TIR domain